LRRRAARCSLLRRGTGARDAPRRARPTWRFFVVGDTVCADEFPGIFRRVFLVLWFSGDFIFSFQKTPPLTSPYYFSSYIWLKLNLKEKYISSCLFS
jgi:hypothetical protein